MLALILFGLFCIFLLYTNPVLIVVVIVLAIIGMVASSKEEQEAREKKAQEEAEQAHIDKENQLLDFFLLCKRKGLKDPVANPEERESLFIIGKNSGFTSKQACLEAFQKGAQINLQREFERKERERERIAQKERDDAAEQKRLADLVGKDKYLSSVEQKLAEYDAAAKAGDFLLKAAGADLIAQPQREDWSVAGGFADAIAGPGAALATVSEIQARNARAEQDAAERRRRAPENMRTAASVKIDAETKYNELKELRDDVADKLVDDGNPEEKYRMLAPQIISSSVTASGNIKVKLVVRLEGTPMLFNEPAILDGSLKISALQNGRKVGTGYYSPVGFGQTDLSKVGFGKSPAKSVLVLVDPQANFDSSLPYDLRIEPYHLWIIEGSA